MGEISFQGILFGIVLIIIGLVVAAGHTEPTWFYPAVGLSFVSGGIVTFVKIMKG